MNDHRVVVLPKGNGLHIVHHETDPLVRVNMFIDGGYTHWVEYDIEQMTVLVEEAALALEKMKARKEKK